MTTTQSVAAPVPQPTPSAPLADPVTLFMAGIIVAMIGSWAKGVIERFGKGAADQGAHNEALAGVVVRVGELERDRSKIADALDRLARLEEFRLHAAPRLDEADETARTLISFTEQVKSVGKRMDALTDMMHALPGAVATELRGMIRPVQQQRAANG